MKMLQKISFLVLAFFMTFAIVSCEEDDVCYTCDDIVDGSGAVLVEGWSQCEGENGVTLEQLEGLVEDFENGGGNCEKN